MSADLIDEAAPLHMQLGRALLLAVSHAYDRATAAGDVVWQEQCLTAMRRIDERLSAWESSPRSSVDEGNTDDE
ncbi:hypothetical protein C8D88_11675 [Lentzea atacamensis]|uniref:Uncharacterized protein n=1 Tax=Lentzea atacamensis TaxID=531938 RepID=A0A316HMW6_9PSEU|nr:hypothetical protein [Lentzea atacamensis]PWK81664.1 hypothetical protein C8D88_11675 [Lentzea atacamensis]